MVPWANLGSSETRDRRTDCCDRPSCDGLLANERGETRLKTPSQENLSCDLWGLSAGELAGSSSCASSCCGDARSASAMYAEPAAALWSGDVSPLALAERTWRLGEFAAAPRFGESASCSGEFAFCLRGVGGPVFAFPEEGGSSGVSGPVSCGKSLGVAGDSPGVGTLSVPIGAD